MIILDNKQLESLKDTKISFSIYDSFPEWINEGIINYPPENIYAEEYSTYCISTEFYTTGAFSYSWSPLPSYMSMGRYCSIAAGVSIMPVSYQTNMFTTASMMYDSLLKHRADFYHDHHYENNDVLNVTHETNHKPIEVGHDVYIGTSAILRRGIKIGDGAIIGAFAVVTKDVEPYSVVVGNPGRVVKKRYSDQQIERLARLKWWNWNFKKLMAFSYEKDIDKLLDLLENSIENGTIEPFMPKKYNLSELLLNNN